MSDAQCVGLGRSAFVATALGMLMCGCAGIPAGRQVSESAWSPAGQPQFEGVVRLNAGSTTADLTLTVYQRIGRPHSIACGNDTAAGERALILGYGIYPQNPHARFPAVTLTVANHGREPMYAVDSVDSIRSRCHPVSGRRLRALAAGDQFSDVGAFPAAPTSSLVAVVTVDGRTVTVPLRPICQHGETQSVHGCVYDPLHWNDQPGFPSLELGSAG